MLLLLLLYQLLLPFSINGENKFCIFKSGDTVQPNCSTYGNYSDSTTQYQDNYGDQFLQIPSIPEPVTVPFSALLGKNSRVCCICIPGQYYKYYPQETSHCHPCLPGYYSDQLNQYKCKGCSVGKYSPSSSADKGEFCEDCPYGRYANEIGANVCKACTIGKYSSEIGAKLESACQDCPLGKYGSEEAKPSMKEGCKNCTLGRFSGGPHSEVGCKYCNPGKYSEIDGRINDCAICPAGFTSDTTEPDSMEWKKCDKCLSGQYQREQGQVSCFNCIPGEYQNQLGSIECKNCLSGHYQPLAGSISCVTCPAGWESQDNSTKCQRCEAGTYSNVTGETCKECEAGQYRQSKEADGVTTTDPTTCVDCPLGFNQNNTGQALCFPCVPGKFSSEGASLMCEDCPIGYFQPKSEQAQCEEVPAGAIVAPGGASSVVVPDGSKIDASSPSGFSACTAGTKGNIPPDYHCKQCPPGKSSTRGATTCTACDKGKFNNRNGSLCKDCLINTYQEQNTEPSLVCQMCPTGFSSKESGSRACEKFNCPILMDTFSVPRFNTSLDGKHVHLAWKRLKIDKTALAFIVQVSTDILFAESRTITYQHIPINKFTLSINATRLFALDNTKINSNITTNPPQFLWDKVLYGRVRTIDKDCGESPWSTNSLSWETASSCSEIREYLQINHTSPHRYKCHECPQGASCEGKTTMRTIVPKFGWWKCPAENVNDDPYNYWQCDYPPNCLGAPNEFLEQQFYNSTEGQLPSPSNDLALIKGFTKGSCAKGRVSNISSNRLCSKCKIGWMPAPVSGECLPCGEDRNGPVVLFGFFCLFTFVFFLLLINCKLRSTGRSKAPHSTLKRTMLTHLQMLSIALSLNVQWPAVVANILGALSSVASVAGGSSSMLHCSDYGGLTDDGQTRVGIDSARLFYRVLIAFTLMPIGFIIGMYLWWIYVVPKNKAFSCGVRLLTKRAKEEEATLNKKKKERRPSAVHREKISSKRIGLVKSSIDKKSQRTVWDAYVSSTVLFIYLLTPTIVRISFSALECKTICKYDYLHLDQNERCWVGQHLLIVTVVAIPSVLLFGLIMPVGAVYFLFRQRELLFKDEGLMFRWGLMYSGYGTSTWWWECVSTFRKTLIIIVVTFLRNLASMQLHIALGVLMVFLHLQHSWRPYHDSTIIVALRKAGDPASLAVAEETEKAIKSLHANEVSSLIVLVVTVWSAVFFGTEKSKCLGENLFLCSVLGLLIIVINIMFLVVNVYTFLSFFWNRNGFDQKMKGIKMKLAKSKSLKRFPTIFGGSGSSKNNSKNNSFHNDVEMTGTTPWYDNPWEEKSVEQAKKQDNKKHRMQKVRRKLSRQYTLRRDLRDSSINSASVTNTGETKKTNKTLTPRRKKSFRKIQAEDVGGDDYFEDIETGETVWVLPENGELVKPQDARRKSGLVDAETGETLWEMPVLE
jgi:hypothetical protein